MLVSIMKTDVIVPRSLLTIFARVEWPQQELGGIASFDLVPSSDLFARSRVVFSDEESQPMGRPPGHQRGSPAAGEGG